MIKVSFLGDISLNNCYNQFFKKGVNPFTSISDLLENSDFNIGNLEALAKGENGENLLKIPRLRTDAATLNLLENLNLEVVTLAHNHVYDNLKDGYDKTIDQLNSQQIKFLGASIDKNEAEKGQIINKNGIKLGLLNYVDINTNPKMPDDAEVFLNYFEIEKAIKHISDFKHKVDHVIILLHWGGRVEEGFYPDFNQPLLARRMVDAGADLIIGGHSHTVQPYEVYKGKSIFYSLGNFCFDDIIQDEEVFQIGRYRKRKTIIPSVIFSKEEYSVQVVHAENIKGFIKPINTTFVKLKMEWRNLIFKILKGNRLLWNIYYWHLKKIVPIKMYFVEANEGVFKKVITLDFKRVFRYILK